MPKSIKGCALQREVSMAQASKEGESYPTQERGKDGARRTVSQQRAWGCVIYGDADLVKQGS